MRTRLLGPARLLPVALRRARPISRKRSGSLHAIATHTNGWHAWPPQSRNLGADAEAAQWARRSIEANRNYPLAHFWLAAALAQLGRLDEARQAVQPGLALAPGFTLARYRAGVQSDNPTYHAQRERIIEGMRKAGVPEG